MDHLEIMSQFDHIGVEATTAYKNVQDVYNRWSVGMSPELVVELRSKIDKIESCCRNIREYLR